MKNKIEPNNNNNNNNALTNTHGIFYHTRRTFAQLKNTVTDTVPANR